MTLYMDNWYINHTSYDDLERLDNQELLHTGIKFYGLMMLMVDKNDAIGAYQQGEREAEADNSLPVLDFVLHFSHCVSSSAQITRTNSQTMVKLFFD